MYRIVDKGGGGSSPKSPPTPPATPLPVQVNGVPVHMVVDTGASADILDEATFR